MSVFWTWTPRGLDKGSYTTLERGGTVLRLNLTESSQLFDVNFPHHLLTNGAFNGQYKTQGDVDHTAAVQMTKSYRAANGHTVPIT